MRALRVQVHFKHVTPLPLKRSVESRSLASARRECGLVAGNQSAARFAQVFVGHVGGDVHTVSLSLQLYAVARLIE